jgi:hypothetical protein
MPEPGRPAAESGNIYHDVTTVHRVIDMVQSTGILDVQPESLDLVDDLRVDFANGTTDFCQVKKESPGSEWTAATLHTEGVLGAFLEQSRRQPASTLRFVTAGNARLLREASERARDARANQGDLAAGVAEWEQRLSGRLNKFVAAIERRLSIERIELFSLLSTITVDDNQGTLNQRRERAIERLAALVDDPRDALVHLERFARESALERRKITAAAVHTLLVEANLTIRPHAWAASFDSAAYAARLSAESDALDAAQLPALEVFVRAHVGRGRERLQPSAIGRLTFLIGSHGAGKSRATSTFARSWLLDGRRGLHVQLSRWATSLANLLVSELSRISDRSAPLSQIEALLGTSTGFLVLDGLDEIPLPDRAAALRQIEEIAATYPQLQILASSRTVVEPLSTSWDILELDELTDEQVSSVLGSDKWKWRWPQSIASLTHNPLMLGLVRPLVGEETYLPQTEPELIGAFLESLAARQAERGDFDALAGMVVMQEAAYRWLTAPSLALSGSALRSLSRDVAAWLRDNAYMASDSAAIERFLLSVGIAVRLTDGVVVPRHRALLDDLAAGALERRDPVDHADQRQLREAMAHYSAKQALVSPHLLTLLDFICRNDLELLARCRALGRRDVAWSESIEGYALAYVRALRLMEAGPLPGLSLIPERVEVRLDKALTWITESASANPDSVIVIDTPDRAHMTTAAGVRIPLQSISGRGYAAREITSQVPHFTAYDRISDALNHALDKHLLPDEGPDIIYERLVRARERIERIFNLQGVPPTGLSSSELERCTTRELFERVSRLVSQLTGGRPGVDLTTCVFAFVPQVGPVLRWDAAPLDVPHDQSGGTSRAIFHCHSLVALASLAESFGFARLPLHPLGLRPLTNDDELLGLPNRRHELHGEQLVLFVRRHDEARLRSYRYIVEHSLLGLKVALGTYQSMPWRVNAVVEDRLDSGPLGGTVFRIVERGTGSDDVVTAKLGTAPKRDEITSWSALSTFDSLTQAVYEMLRSDTRDVLAGRYSLGAQSL